MQLVVSRPPTRLTSSRCRERKRHDRGYDVAKRMAGSERHLLVETNRLVLAARVHSTDLPDRAAGGGC